MAKRKDLIYRIGFALLSAAMLVLSCIFLGSLHRAVKLTAMFAFTVGLLVFCLVDGKYKVPLRITTVVIVFLTVITVAYIFVEQMGWLVYFEDFDTIRNFILKSGEWGVIIFLILTVLQVVFLPIPAAVTILIGVVICLIIWLILMYAG